MIQGVREYPHKARTLVGEDHTITVRPNPNKDVGEMSGPEYNAHLVNKALTSEKNKIGAILTKNGINVPEDKSDDWLNALNSQLVNSGT